MLIVDVDKHYNDASAVTNFRCHKLIAKANKYKNSSGDEMANVNFYSVRPESYQIR